MVAHQPILEGPNIDSSSGAVSTGERREDLVAYQPTLNCANIDSRSVTSASSFEEAENVSEKVTETRETTAQAVLRVENAELDTAGASTDIQLAVEASSPKAAWQDEDVYICDSVCAR